MISYLGLLDVLATNFVNKMVRVAVVQAGSYVYDTKKTLDKLEKLVGEAANKGAQLVLFPGRLSPIFFMNNNNFRSLYWRVSQGIGLRGEVGQSLHGGARRVQAVFRRVDRVQ